MARAPDAGSSGANARRRLAGLSFWMARLACVPGGLSPLSSQLGIGDLLAFTLHGPSVNHREHTSIVVADGLQIPRLNLSKLLGQ